MKAPTASDDAYLLRKLLIDLVPRGLRSAADALRNPFSENLVIFLGEGYLSTLSASRCNLRGGQAPTDNPGCGRWGRLWLQGILNVYPGRIGELLNVAIPVRLPRMVRVLRNC